MDGINHPRGGAEPAKGITAGVAQGVIESVSQVQTDVCGAARRNLNFEVRPETQEIGTGGDAGRGEFVEFVAGRGNAGIAGEPRTRLKKVSIKSDGTPEEQRIVQNDTKVVQPQAVSSSRRAIGCVAETVEVLFFGFHSECRQSQ